ncbi:MAG: hypothetical protein A2104_08710 [Candidatus Melainabacteria bacterium GWF2_32_7]|nr:MAG: hypothetical protein A2104_08710 [Candidatus Melainabacteria bacterium GWF2_32_7]
MEAAEKIMSIASNERIQGLIIEAENELAKIQPEIAYLEECQKKLVELNEQKFKLNSLIASLKVWLKIPTLIKESVIKMKLVKIILKLLKSKLLLT